jgi:hypothetical protein
MGPRVKASPLALLRQAVAAAEENPVAAPTLEQIALVERLCAALKISADLPSRKRK